VKVGSEALEKDTRLQNAKPFIYLDTFVQINNKLYIGITIAIIAVLTSDTNDTTTPTHPKCHTGNQSVGSLEGSKLQIANHHGE
jgi:hypothetical protein